MFSCRLLSFWVSVPTWAGVVFPVGNSLNECFCLLFFGGRCNRSERELLCRCRCGSSSSSSSTAVSVTQSSAAVLSRSLIFALHEATWASTFFSYYPCYAASHCPCCNLQKWMAACRPQPSCYVSPLEVKVVSGGAASEALSKIWLSLAKKAFIFPTESTFTLHVYLLEVSRRFTRIRDAEGKAEGISYVSYDEKGAWQNVCMEFMEFTCFTLHKLKTSQLWCLVRLRTEKVLRLTHPTTLHWGHLHKWS